MYSLVSTRFNNKTIEENMQYRTKNGIKGCIYGVPYTMSPKIMIDQPVFVLEMNNSANRLEGIGLLKNRAKVDHYYNSIYDDRNFNRITYAGKYRIDRYELEKTNMMLVTILDHILFKEKTHLKRGIGFTSVPEKLLKHRMCDGLNVKTEIRNIFMHLIKCNEKREVECDSANVNTSKIKKKRKIIIDDDIHIIS